MVTCIGLNLDVAIGTLVAFNELGLGLVYICVSYVIFYQSCQFVQDRNGTWHNE
jgi:hypothetical protein